MMARMTGALTVWPVTVSGGRKRAPFVLGGLNFFTGICPQIRCRISRGGGSGWPGEQGDDSHSNQNICGHLSEQPQVKVAAIKALYDHTAGLLLFILVNDQPCVTHGPGGQHRITKPHQLGRVRVTVPKVNGDALHWLRFSGAVELEAHYPVMDSFTAPMRDNAAESKLWTTLNWIPKRDDRLGFN